MVGVLLVVVVGLGALEDDEEDDEDRTVDEVAPALHAERQHHLHQKLVSPSLVLEQLQLNAQSRDQLAAYSIYPTHHSMHALSAATFTD